MARGAFRLFTFVSAIAPWLLTGCVSNHYELEMTVEGDTLHRQLVCSRATGQDPPNLQSMPDGELERISSEYGTETPQNEARKFEFHGEFSQQTPDDVGGAGTLTMYETSLGRTWAYVERFRGDDDLNTSLADREASVDQLVDALEHWFARELGDTRDGERMRALLNGDLHHDFHNVAKFAWLAGAVDELAGADSSPVTFDIVVRLGQFGLERNYLTPQDVPELVAFAENPDRELLPMMRRMLAAKLGPDVPVHKWRFLDSPESIAASMNDKLGDFPPYQSHAATWRQANPERELSDMPKPADWVGDSALQSLGIAFAGTDALTAKLHCPTRPFQTNGEWSDEAGAVVWEKRIPSRDPADDADEGVLPVVLFAFWSVADEERQTEHFGNVILENGELADYIMWRKSLPDAEGAEWDGFIAGLQSGPDLRTQVEEFRFASDPPEGDDSQPVLSQKGRALLLTALDGEGE